MKGIWQGYLVRGALALALGFAALFWPLSTVDVLVRVVGAFAMLNGAVSLFSAYRGRLSGASRIPGLFTLAVGGVLLVWPGFAVHVLFVILGVLALIQGAGLWLMSRGEGVGAANRGLLGVLSVVILVTGLILVFWPWTGAVAVSWVIAALALLVGSVWFVVGVRLRRAGAL